MDVSTVKNYMLLLLILGVVTLVVSIVMLNEGIAAICIPLLIVPSASLVGLRNGSPVMFYRYLIHGLILSLILELVSYVMFATIAGKAVSMALSLGIVFYLVHEAYSKYRESRKCAQLREFEEAKEEKPQEGITENSEGEKEEERAGN